MNPRTAKKIVNRVEGGSVTHRSYSRPDVREAFAMFDRTLTDKHLKPWTDEDDRKAKSAGMEGQRQQATADKKAAKAARIEARRVAKEANRRRKAGLQGEKVNQQIAAAGGREAFKQAIENEVDEMPESVEVAPETVGEADNTYAEMSVKALKAECKTRGFTGYSGLKRPELTAMLVADDQQDGL